MGNSDRVSVVVTGLGATTPLGGDAASTWSAMLAGTSGVRRITEPWVEKLPVKIAAPAAADPVAVIGRPQARKMDRCEQFALVAAREAWADAGSPDRCNSSNRSNVSTYRVQSCGAWAAGDRTIDVIGFSRGAATTLDFCYRIQKDGIRRPGTQRAGRCRP